MLNRTKHWLGRQNKTENYLDPVVARAALVGETFTAICTVAFLKWMDKHREELKSTMQSVAELREACFKELEVHWPEFQGMAAKRSDDRLYAVLEEHVDLADAMGLMQWQKDTGYGQDSRLRDHDKALTLEKTPSRKM